MLRRLSLALVLLAGTATTGTAQTLSTLANDAEFAALVASGGFVPLVAGHVGGAPAAPGGGNIGILGPNSVLFQNTVSWPGAQVVRDGVPTHRYSFSIGNDGGWFADLWLPDATEGASGEVTAQVMAGPGSFADGFFNTLVIRASSSSLVGTSFHSALSLYLRAAGETIELAPFAGDEDGSYLVVTDRRLGWGLQLEGLASFLETSGVGVATAGGAPSYTFIVGNAPVSAVPEPATYALMATGLAGLGLATRRRRSAR